MKKQILNLGKALNKAEQKKINGGIRVTKTTDCECYCYVNGNQRSTSCSSLCSNGSTPAIVGSRNADGTLCDK